MEINIVYVIESVFAMHEETKWYKLDEKERIKEVYSKYTIKQFWDWWANGDIAFMEVRIKDWELIKQVGKKFNIPFSSSGVYVKNDIELKNVIAMVRDQATIWFGINTRKKNWNRRGWKSFEGKDPFVDNINYIFIDIDRVLKEGPATKIDLENSDKLANLILDRLKQQKWNKGYIKICSGNGVQLLIKLDVPIKIPNIEFDNKTKTFIPNNEFEKVKQLIKKGIGKQIVSFTNKFKEELGVEVDVSGMLIGKVGAIHCTKNYKYGGFTWRGLIELEEGENTGLSDYLLTFEDDIKEFKAKNVFSTKHQTRKDIIRQGKLKENVLVKLLLENDFPEGYINNTLWFQLKCLLRDSKYDIHDKEFIIFHNEIKRKHKRDFSANVPEKHFSFNKNTINNYCLQCGLPIIYDFLPNKTKRMDRQLENLDWKKHVADETEVIKLDSETTILEDMEKTKDKLIEGNLKNIQTVAKFTRGCIQKYGEKKTKYYFDNLFYKYFSYD